MREGQNSTVTELVNWLPIILGGIGLALCLTYQTQRYRFFDTSIRFIQPVRSVSFGRVWRVWCARRFDRNFGRADSSSNSRAESISDHRHGHISFRAALLSFRIVTVRNATMS
jgi:hypothetical protein